MEIEFAGQWGTVCDDAWGVNDGNVRHLWGIDTKLKFQSLPGVRGVINFGELGRLNHAASNVHVCN